MVDIRLLNSCPINCILIFPSRWLFPASRHGGKMYSVCMSGWCGFAMSSCAESRLDASDIVFDMGDGRCINTPIPSGFAFDVSGFNHPAYRKQTPVIDLLLPIASYPQTLPITPDTSSEPLSKKQLLDLRHITETSRPSNYVQTHYDNGD